MMMYPTGYGPAEHKRALDAILADIATSATPKPEPEQSDAGKPSAPRVRGATSARAHCAVELRVTAEVIARA